MKPWIAFGFGSISACYLMVVAARTWLGDSHLLEARIRNWSQLFTSQMALRIIATEGALGLGVTAVVITGVVTSVSPDRPAEGPIRLLLYFLVAVAGGGLLVGIGIFMWGRPRWAIPPLIRDDPRFE